MKEINAVTLDSAAYIAGQMESIKPSNKGSASFDSFMDISTKASTGNVQADVQPKQDTARPVQVTGQEASQRQPVKSMEDASSTQDNSSVVEDAALVQSVSDKITDVVKDALEIDDATLSNAMTALGITPLDLLDVSNMQQLVLFINGSSDVTDLLTDEFMMMDLNNLSDAIAQIDWEGMTGMSKEDFIQALEQSLSMADNNDTVAAVQEDVITVTTEIYTEEADVPEDVQLYNNVKTDNVVLETSQEVQKQPEDQPDGIKLVQTMENPVKEETPGTGQQMAESQTESTMQESTQTEIKEPVQGEALNGTNAFLQNLGKAVAEVQGNQGPQQSGPQQMVDIVNQVVEQIKVTLGKETTTMQMQLNPENLGKVLVSVTSKNGVMTANFTVQSEEAKEALQSQMYSLREAIESRSLKVDAVEVEVSDFAFSQSSQADAQQEQKDYEKNDGRRFRFNFENSGIEEDGSTVSDSTSSQKPRRLDAGTSIDFTA